VSTKAGAFQLRLGTVASLWRDGLVLVSNAMCDALTGVMPPEADVQEIEVHAYSPRDAAGGMRVLGGTYDVGTNSVDQRIDLSPLGQRSPSVGESLGAAAQVCEPLTELDAAQLVVKLLDYIALANGFTDPRTGIAAVRSELGLEEGQANVS
jgi:hypothetical protein